MSPRVLLTGGVQLRVKNTGLNVARAWKKMVWSNICDGFISKTVVGVLYPIMHSIKICACVTPVLNQAYRDEFYRSALDNVVILPLFYASSGQKGELS